MTAGRQTWRQQAAGARAVAESLYLSDPQAEGWEKEKQPSE